MLRHAERLLGACLLAALCGCAAVQEPRPTARSGEAQPASTPASAAPVVSAAPSVDMSSATEPAPLAAPEPLAEWTLELLRDAEQYAILTPDAQQQMLAEAEIRYDMEQTPLTLVHYALLLSLSEPDRQSSAGAAAALRDLLAAPTGTAERDLGALARLLMYTLDEREHLLARNVELQHKLNQLKAIERQLGNRDGVDATHIPP
jgi:hypothetical protein